MAEQKKEKTVLKVKDKEEFEKYLQDAGDKLVVVDFYAEWCGPCKMIAPKIQKMADEMEMVIFLKVDVDESGEIAEEQGIEAMPTFRFFKRGEKVIDFVGANDAKLREMITKITPEQVKI